LLLASTRRVSEASVTDGGLQGCRLKAEY